MLPFIIGVSIPLLFCAIFWRQLRERRVRILKWLKNKFKRER